MSLEDDFEQFMNADGELNPEDFFQMVTIMPHRKIKMVAYLEDKDGDRIELKTVAKNLTSYINEHMAKKDNTPVNSQMFPLINQMMVSAVPRQVGIGLASFLFTARSSRMALSTFGMYIALLMRYIQQHDLKIVTEETKITDKELESYYAKEREADARLQEVMLGGEDDLKS